MTATDFDNETDEERAEREAAEAADRQGGNAAAAARRRAEKERDDARAENETLKAQLAKRDRADALRDTFAELGVDTTKGIGKLYASTYAAGEGEATADAVRAAVLADPDLATALNVTPDIRDAAAAEQGRNAAAMNGGDQGAKGALTEAVVNDWPLARKEQFRAQHPEVWQRLLDAPETPVPVPVGWA